MIAVTRKGRWTVVRRDTGAQVSQHDAIENAIESAAKAGVLCDIKPPLYEVAPTTLAPAPAPEPAPAPAPEPAPSPVPESPADATYEAEGGVFGGGATVQTTSSASGGKAVGTMLLVGAFCRVIVDGGLSGGARSLVIRYANGHSSVRVMSLYVNGAKKGQVSFPVTSGWAKFVELAPVAVQLAAGPNELMVRTDSGDTPDVDLDYFRVVSGEVVPAPAPAPTPAPAPQWSTPAEISLAPGQAFDLRTTLPIELPAGGTFGVGSGGLPQGVSLSAAGLLSAASAAPAASVRDVVFSYTF